MIKRKRFYPQRRRDALVRSSVFLPTQVASLVAHWSGNGATVASAPNRSLEGTVGAMAQATAADQPTIYTLPNGVRTLRFEGDQTQDLKVADVAALRNTGANNCWAFHLRLAGPMPATAYLYSQWAEGGSAERVNIVYTPGNERVAVSLAIDATTVAVNRFVISRSDMAKGGWLVIKNFGDAGTNAGKLRCFFNDVEVSSLSITGTNPAALPEGDATNVWLGSLNGASNGTWDIAHAYVFNDVPSDADLLRIKSFEAPQWERDCVACDGHSIMRGLNNGTDASIPTLLKPLIASSLGVQNFGVSGHTVAQRDTAFEAGVHSFFQSGRANRVVLLGLGNEILADADTATTLAALAAYVTAARAAGWTVITCTCLPRTNAAWGDAGARQLVADDVNAEILLDPTTYGDVIVPLHQNAGLDDPADTGVYSDGLHLNGAGCALAAADIAAVVNAL